MVEPVMVCYCIRQQANNVDKAIFGETAFQHFELIY